MNLAGWEPWGPWYWPFRTADVLAKADVDGNYELFASHRYFTGECVQFRVSAIHPRHERRRRNGAFSRVGGGARLRRRRGTGGDARCRATARNRPCRSRCANGGRNVWGAFVRRSLRRVSPRSISSTRGRPASIGAHWTQRWRSRGGVASQGLLMRWMLRGIGTASSRARPCRIPLSQRRRRRKLRRTLTMADLGVGRRWRQSAAPVSGSRANGVAEARA